MRLRAMMIVALGTVLGLGPVAFADDADGPPGHYAPVTLQAADAQAKAAGKEHLSQQDILASSAKTHAVRSVNILDVPSANDENTAASCRPEGALHLDKKIDVIDVR